MKTVLILFVSLVLTGASVIAVQAEEGQALSESGMAEQPVTEESAAEREAYAKSLFEGRCQMCHQLPEPGMLRTEQWKLILTTMQQRMQQAGVPPLTEDETEHLLEYLAERAR
jgi:mono/diheme cytochrome c family protein